MNIQRMIHLAPQNDPFVQYLDRIVNIVVAAYPKTINIKSSRFNRFFDYFPQILHE